ncbi:MAG: GtrA family protein [Prevotella sp.]|nr:GtrA family protein [Prevotella sp.]MCM1075664.1 GtrA family protein [Ruminococcus sp.]
MSTIKKATNKFLNSDNVVFEFLRSIFSSQAASWIDMFMSFAFFAWLGIQPWLATICGAAAGGITNCIINYKFTFHANDCPWKAVIVKYIMIWLGSVAFNSLGTEFFYRLLSNWSWLRSVTESEEVIFGAVRLAVSLVVSLGWNFVMQRNFVYRPTKFDTKAIALVDFLIVKKHPKN